MWLTIACIAVALVGGAAVARIGWPVLALLVGGSVVTGLAMRRPFHVWLVLWFVTALVPHGNLGDLWFRRNLGVPVHPIDLLFWFALGTWLLAWLRDRFDLRRFAGHMSLAPPMLAVLFSIMVALFVGVVNGHEVWDLFRDARNAALWLMLPIAWVELSTERRIRTALGVITAGTLLYAAAITVVSFLPDTQWPRSVILDHWRGSARIYFHNHFVFLTVLPLVTTYAIAGHRFSARMWRALPAPMIVWATWASMTRSLIVLVPAMACFAVLALSVMHRERGRIRRPVSVMIAALLAFGIGWKAIETMRPSSVPDGDSAVARRFSALGSDPTEKDVSLKGRVQSYHLAFEQGGESPTYGHGLGTLLRVPWANQLGGPGNTRTKGFQPAVDNAPLTVLVKAGALGLVASAWLLLCVVWLQLSAILRARGALDRLWIPVALLSGTLGILAISQLQATLLTSRYILLFSVFAAISDRYANRTRQGSRSAPASTLGVPRRRGSR